MVRTGFSDLVLVCTKCAKRQGMKKGAVRVMLKRSLKHRANLSGSRKSKARVVEVGCLGPCPKRALAVATSASLAAHRIHLLDPLGSPEAAAALLFPDFGPKDVLGAGSIETS